MRFFFVASRLVMCKTQKICRAAHRNLFYHYDFPDQYDCSYIYSDKSAHLGEQGLEHVDAVQVGQGHPAACGQPHRQHE